MFMKGRRPFMSKKRKIISLAVLLFTCVLLLIGIFLTGSGTEKSETIKETMKDAVLHESNKISLFGIKDVNPAVVSAFTLTAILLIAALIIRIFVIPRFKIIPGKFQIALESAVGLFKDMAESNSPHKNKFLGAYIFAAGSYIFISTLFELLGLQGVTTLGHSIALPAPLSDINAAIAMGCMSYLVILSGGITGNGFKGVLNTLKDFSLPVSMSFRLFGALLSGLLVTELVYYYLSLSFVLPVIVGILFTLIHALIQAYVLTMLTALFYGEVSESHKKQKKIKTNKNMAKAKKAAV